MSVTVTCSTCHGNGLIEIGFYAHELYSIIKQINSTGKYRILTIENVASNNQIAPIFQLRIMELEGSCKVHIISKEVDLEEILK